MKQTTNFKTKPKFKITIDVINKYFYPVAAGIETNIMEVYVSFAKKRYKVTIHASRNILSAKNVLPKNGKVGGLTVKRYTYYWYRFFPKIDWNGVDIIALHNFDVLPHSLILIYSWILKITGRKKFKLILTPHGFTPDWKIFPKIQVAIKWLHQNSSGVFLINNVVDGIRAVSEWEKLEMTKHGINPNLIKVINNGIEEDAFKNLDKLTSRKIKTIVKQNKPYIVQIGRIHPIKNYETAIKALVKLPKKLNYLIVGPEQDREYKYKLEKLITELNLKNRVKFLGVRRGVDKYYLLKQAELMVHMAHWESFCNTVHEGMSQGLVCIVSNKTALPFLIKDGLNGYCLEPRDHQGLAKKIKFVLGNKKSQKIKEIQKRNLNFAKKHSWENVAKQVEQFYLGTFKRHF